MSEVSELFLELYGRLPRAGPGDEASTLRALAVVRREVEPHRVLDAGCGPGAQTLVLASALPQAEIVAVDELEWMVRRAREAIATAGLEPRVRAEVADMRTPPGLEPGSVDLVWCEGAIYGVGVQAALEAWRPLLSPAGHAVFSELTWFGSERPADAQAFLDEEYPPMSDVEGNRERVEAAGFRVVESFALPESAWWRDFYTPLLARVEELSPRGADDPDARALLDRARLEADLFRRHAQAYGYTFFVVRPA